MPKSSRSPDNPRRRRRSRSNSSANSTSSDGDHRHSSSKKRRSKRSRSRTRSKDGSRYKSKTSSRSSSRDRRRRHPRSRSRSWSRSRGSHSPSVLQARRAVSDKTKGSAADSSSGLNSLSMGNLTPEEQLKTKMQMALKAAAEADAQLREKGILTSSRNNAIKDSSAVSNDGNNLSVQEQIGRAQAIELINAPGFVPQDFVSNHSDKSAGNHGPTEFSGFDSQQGARLSSNSAIDKLIQNELAHENLFANKELRQEKWVRRLYTMRQKRLNGDIMS